ncbi:copper oxidase, partial [Streptomyces sp. IBSBF 2953]|nr:copper oxidase [Streptomyces hayashii]
SDYYNTHKRTVSDFINDVADKGWSATVADRKMWAEMKMNPTDIADVSGATYTYLMNGHAPNSNWTGTFKPGEKLRLRFINGSAMSYFDVRIPGLKMTVVAADGQYVKPVSVDEFRIATAETFDVIVEPTQDAYTLFAQSMDRSGYARGTLAVRSGMTAPVPALDPRPLVTMADMGMAGMDHGAMPGMGDMAGMDHSKMAGMGDDSMQGMSGMDGGAMKDSSGSMQGMSGMNSMQGMDHSNMSMGGISGMGEMQSHPATESNNPLVDMQAMSTSAKLDDPS